MVNFVESAGEFYIVEKKNGLRSWDAFDKYGNWSWNHKFLTRRNYVRKDPRGGSCHWDDFIEDGWLVSRQKIQGTRNGKIDVILDIRDSITTDRQGNVIWKYMWSCPLKGVKMTKVTWATRVDGTGVPKNRTKEDFWPVAMVKTLMHVAGLFTRVLYG